MLNGLKPKGLAVLFAIPVAYAAIFALSYPLAQYSGVPMLSLIVGGLSSLIYFTLSALGAFLAIKNRDEITARDLLASAALAGLVWVSVEYRYLFNDWTPLIPFYDPTFNAVEVFLMTLGALTVNKNRLIRYRLAEGGRKAGRSLALGFILGIPFALVNLALFVYVYGRGLGVGDVVYGCLNALQPGIMEEVAYRYLFMGASISLLEGHVARKTAARLSIAMAVLFHSLPHVHGILLSNPLMALVTVLVSSLLFGLPMALLAYRRDIETAISFHWTIDAIRFILVG